MAEPLAILITGGTGQVGLALQRLSWPQDVVLHAPSRVDMDLADASAVSATFVRTHFAAVINAAAYTAVDRAEEDAATAFGVNALGPAVLADVTRMAGVPLIQVSTDHVFDGFKAAPYVEEDAVGPLNVYGASKLAGEMAARRGNPRSVVLRTAAVLSTDRSNFLKTMLRLGGERSDVRVVEDQHVCPTSAHDLAQALRAVTLKMIADSHAPTGIYHFANAGSATWADLAREIFARSLERGGPFAEVEGIPSSAYPAAARRPMNARLSTLKLTRDYGVIPRSWRSAVAEIVAELVGERSPP